MAVYVCEGGSKIALHLIITYLAEFREGTDRCEDDLGRLGHSAKARLVFHIGDDHIGCIAARDAGCGVGERVLR